MNAQQIFSVPEDEFKVLLSSIPFYKAVKKQDEGQFEVLMSFSRIFHYRSGEKILSAGDKDSWAYFVIKGQLVVSAIDQEGSNNQVNYVTPGQVVGDLSLYLQQPRTADVLVDSSCREAVLFGTDFGAFGELNNFNYISLQTKLLYYRQAIHTLRWKLDMYRLQYGDHCLANKHRDIKPYIGQKDTLEELLTLHQQAGDLAKLLVQWNQNFGHLVLPS